MSSLLHIADLLKDKYIQVVQGKPFKLDLFWTSIDRWYRENTLNWTPSGTDKMFDIERILVYTLQEKRNLGLHVMIGIEGFHCTNCCICIDGIISWLGNVGLAFD